jgi:D-serine deaminase-like pyridoxal phosphate-dependent protein
MQHILPQIEKPTMVLDESRAKRNIERMVSKARENAVDLRPHFKTHQSATIGEWFRDKGIESITVSSVDMADYFIAHDWRDVTIAFPFNLRQTRRLKDIAGKAKVNILVESIDVVLGLDEAMNRGIDVWLKIDTGYHRTGIAWDDNAGITGLAQAILKSDHLRLIGLLTHAGHTYGSSSPAKIEAIYQQTLARLKEVQNNVRRLGAEVAISVGDTPGCSVVDDLGDVDEIRPGNFVFYDMSQVAFGSCLEEDVAVAVACPIVAKHEHRNQIVLYGGATHLSKESQPGPNGRPVFGKIASPASRGWSATYEGNYVVSLSQEHGIVQADATLFDKAQVGGILMVIPVHSCLTANLLGRYLTLDGNHIEMARY